MDDEMQQLIKLLEEMGATEIEFKDEINNDACLSFMFGGKKAVIWGTGRNDETGGLFVEITPV